jgi:ppGpp synthetase/RelA/SpoT-type nucleotidyltranferase
VNGVTRTVEQWGEEYRRVRPLHASFTGELGKLVEHLLGANGIAFDHVESRAKDVPNFVAKLARKGNEYKDPLRDVTDLVGLRVIVYYLDDVKRVGALLEREFDIDFDNSDDTAQRLDPDRFGYISSHYVVRLSEPRNTLAEWASYNELVAEVQVRTVLQHAWAAINRQLNYGSVREAPRELQRSLSRLSALLELGDKEFLDVRSARESIEAEYERALGEGDLNLEIDDSSLDAYFDRFDIRERIEALAKAAGSIPYEADPEWVERERQDLLEGIRMAGITSVAELHEQVEAAWDWIPSLMARSNEVVVARTETPLASNGVENWLTLIVLRAAEAPREAYEQLSYMDDLVDAVLATYDGFD